MTGDPAGHPADQPPPADQARPADQAHPADRGPESDHRRRQIGRAGVVSSATMTSRVLGLLREHVFAKLFGTGAISDAFVIAYRIPNLLRDLFAEGALSSAFVPTFTEQREKDGDAAAFALARIVFTFMFAVVGGIVILGVIFAPSLVDLIAPGFDHTIEATSSAAEGLSTGPGGRIDQRELTIQLTRILMPFLLLVSLAAVCRGVLNSYHRYFLPAVSPALFNLVSVGVGFALWFAGSAPEVAVHAWAMATLAGGVVQLVIQFPALAKLGFSYRVVLDLGHAGFRRILRLMGPATIGLAAVQVNILVNSIIASLLEEGAPTWLQLGFRLVYLPIGVIGVAVATVTTVNLSTHAAQRDLDRFRQDLASALRLVAFLTVPAAAGLIALDVPIVRLIFEYGRFGGDSTALTAAALTCYATGLFCYSAVKIVAPAFYALNRIRVPMVASICGVAVNVAWSLATYRTLGYTTLAVGTALASTVNLTILIFAVHHRIGLHGRGLTSSFARVVLLAVGMAVVVNELHHRLESALGFASLGARVATVFIPIAVGAAIVILGGVLLRLPEASDLLAVFLRRRRAPADPTDS